MPDMERNTRAAITITLTVEELNLLRDALSYCDLASGWGAGDGFDSEDLDALKPLARKLDEVTSGRGLANLNAASKAIVTTAEPGDPPRELPMS